ncbi:ABC transporter ATP-binding [Tenacibaculum phage pT24]|uniref:ABC transporter ATP-binding n=1 Tax=Tenacibaculum phage pT24 TaxID=1880590 RepID=A0A1B4XWH5_9CAUD|nr:ABC transporter ATP-binding [Tenacibaculum phage pT24]BAV39159.1 ABC transporter ATP-binding [Tenacibaculum phage pT24]
MPDFQGLGLGYQISNFTGAIYKADGRRYYTKTVHPALGESRNKNVDDWKPTGDNGKVRKKRNAPRPYESHWAHNSRISYCHEYIGKEVHGYGELIKPISEMRKDKKNREKLQK